ncbi:hypothetical protein BMW23_0722 [Bodo saltans virus]|uniref:Uncharacterized protein n=1 Tax=Bodo saltans virus TaxID=2024608 RepID=A0A2H4UV21_9VIRU|nr:hypothetical protein QJ851_gp0705 [Bodo saltans virus]ATZ80768.1 hypothetical protein BMW23_0722 [Bodo saltans virus]
MNNMFPMRPQNDKSIPYPSTPVRSSSVNGGCEAPRKPYQNDRQLFDSSAIPNATRTLFPTSSQYVDDDDDSSSLASLTRATSARVSPIVRSAKAHFDKMQDEMQRSASSSTFEESVLFVPPAQLPTRHSPLPAAPVTADEFLKVAILGDAHQFVVFGTDDGNRELSIWFYVTMNGDAPYRTCITWDEVFPRMDITHGYAWGNDVKFAFSAKNNVIIEILVQFSKLKNDRREPIAVATTLEHCGKSVDAYLCLDKDGKIFVRGKLYMTICDKPVTICKVCEL